MSLLGYNHRLKSYRFSELMAKAPFRRFLPVYPLFPPLLSDHDARSFFSTIPQSRASSVISPPANE